MLPLLHKHLVSVEILAATGLGVKRFFLLLLILLVGLLEIAQILRRFFYLKCRVTFTLHLGKLCLRGGWVCTLAFVAPLRRPGAHGVVFNSRRRVLVDALFIVDFPTRSVESIQQIVSGQLLDHAHELLDTCSDPLSIENGHEIVDERLLVWERDQLVLALLLELPEHVVLILVHFNGPLEELGLRLQVRILALEHVVDAHRDNALEDDDWRAEGLTFSQLLKDAHI